MKNSLFRYKNVVGSGYNRSIPKERKLMKSLLIMAIALVSTAVIVTFLPLAPVAITILVFMLGVNAVMAIVFAIMALELSN